MFFEVLNRRVALSYVSALFFVQKREAEGRKRKGRFEADYLQRRDTWSGGLVCEKTEGRQTGTSTLNPESRYVSGGV